MAPVATARRHPQPPRPRAEASRPPVDTPARERFAVNLARAADFVPQYTFEWCVGASLQMARSIITGKRNETRRSQRGCGSSPGASRSAARTAAPIRPVDGGVQRHGLGPYRLASLPTFEAAVAGAARAIAETGRPVGLVMWAGPTRRGDDRVRIGGRSAQSRGRARQPRRRDGPPVPARIALGPQTRRPTA